MSTPIAYPLINGVRHSFASTELKIVIPGSSGIIVRGYTAFNYKRDRKRETVMGAHVDPLGKTIGENEYSADLELYLAEANYVVEQLTNSLGGADGYGDVPFDILMTYLATGFDPIVDTIRGCTWDSNDANPAKGPAPLVRKVNLNPTKIIFNGSDDTGTPLAVAGQ